MTETFEEYVGGLVYEANRNLTPDDWKHIIDGIRPRLYYLVRYYPHAAQHDYYLVRSGHTRVELPGYRGRDAQWTFEECQSVDPQHHYKWVLVEGDD